MNPSLLHGGEDTSGLHNIFITSITPFDVGRISLLEDGDGLPIDDKLSILSLDHAFELAMSRIILEHVDHVVEVNERVIDGDNVHFARVKGSPGDQAPNTAKSVHSDLHHRVSGLRLALSRKTRLSVELEEQRAWYSVLKKEILPFATTQMDLEDTVLSEIRQTQKSKRLCDLPYMCSL